ncbi:MAG: tRNA (N6-isopentenyl adenosine(37)-C2)-methylthiotransferase MiaB, partial [Desulfocapsa sp.]|nr:tRNA (N6-isopentenyl adenosine(37)-C2)-methylthiotransferase MiaB [Desulfocapsa sp.]
YSFKYSDRPGTRSESFEDKVEESVKSERLLRFQTRQDEICLKHNQGYVGKNISAMIEKNNGDSLVARAGTNHLIHIQNASSCIPGDIRLINIHHAGHHSLQGTLMDK